MDEDWVTAVQAADIIGCHLLTVYRFSRAGLLRRKKEPGQAKASFSASDAEALKISRVDAIRAKAKQNKNHAKVKHRVEAICPRCKKTHMSTRAWAGEGRPYFFCPKCQAIEAYGMASPWQNMAMV